MDNLVRNERLKLVAGALDRASTACIAVGLIAPVSAAIYQVALPQTGIGIFIVGAVIWILAAAGLHLFAQRVLGGLRQ